MSKFDRIFWSLMWPFMIMLSAAMVMVMVMGYRADRALVCDASKGEIKIYPGRSTFPVCIVGHY